MTPPFLTVQGNALCISVKAQPRARTTGLAGIIGNELKIRVTAPPVDSAANEALEEFLSHQLDCPRSAITLIRGRTNSHKVFRIEGVPLESAVAALS
jgi:uncharacterized protein (TIGR00251 family)